MKLTDIRIGDIRIDWDLNPRLKDIGLIDTYEADIREYGEQWQCYWGEKPKITEDSILYSGFHTVSAVKRIFDEDYRLLVTIGGKGRRAAQLLACSQNAHGKPRSYEEKRRAVLTLLNDPTWCRWSNHEIARRCRVSNPFVGKLRKQLTANVNSDTASTRIYTTKDGTDATMKVSGIGRLKPPANPARPPASWDEADPWIPTAAELDVIEPEVSPQGLLPESAEFIACLQEVLGTIDWDAALKLGPQEVVRAARLDTARAEGRSRPQIRSLLGVGGDLVAGLVSKFLAALESAEVREAILLTYSATETTWYQECVLACDLMCFPTARSGLKFDAPDGKMLRAPRGQTVFYFGENEAKFHEVFGKLGVVLCHFRFSTSEAGFGEVF